jgi:hypothetical protein
VCPAASTVFPPAGASSLVVSRHFVGRHPFSTEVNRIAADIGAVLHDPQVKQRFLGQGAEPIGDASPEAFPKRLRHENARLAKPVRDAGMQFQ